MSNKLNTSQPQKPAKKRHGWLVLGFIAIAAMVVMGVVKQAYWLIYLAAAITLIFAYFGIGLILAKKYKDVLHVQCNPYKYYRYLKTCRALFFFISYNKNEYKIELAMGLRNMGNFEKAKEMMLTIDTSRLSSAEAVVLYYHNLCDIMIWQNDYVAASEAIQNGFAALEKITDEKSKETWSHSLEMTQRVLHMSEEITDSFEELLIADLRAAEKQYIKIEYRIVLGQYYYLTKQYSRALEQFEYIVKHGNKLFHVQEAKKYIDGIKSII